jgi:arylsulfatase A-like enzyme/cytochrome c-type biogenesis protein CcmH/NrfG
MYGSRGKAETPAFDALRKDGVLFERAYAVTPLTFPSHASLLTGMFPAQHGVRDNVGYPLDRAKMEKGEITYLPRLLKQAGYATGGAVSAYVLLGKNGLSEGFDFYEDSIEFRSSTGLGGLQRPGGETLKLAQDWVGKVAEKPFFLFFHIYEPHTPYDPPEPFASRYESKYDGEIAAADRIVGNLIADLKERKLYDQAMIVLLADHGEGLGDHGEDEHGVFLYEEAIRVPLLVKLPEAQRAGGSVARPVELTDVAPTVLGLLGLEVPKAMPGVSLFADNVPARKIYSETFYPRLHFGWSELFSLVDEAHHYIEGPDPELYDRAADPGEKKNVLRDERRAYAAMKKEMEKYDRTLKEPVEVDQEAREAMRSLGYIGSGGGASSGPLPDPKTKIASLADLRQGFQLLGEKKYPEATAAFRKVIASNPQMVDAWEFLGHALERGGRMEEALQAYQEALKISGGSPEVAVSAASLFFDLGRMGDARAHAKMALRGHGSFAHGLLARIALEEKNLEEAEKEARAAMEDEKGTRIGPMVTLAEVLHARRDGRGALEQLRQAEAVYAERSGQDKDLLRGLNLIKGKVLADQGDGPGAEAAFRQELALFPESLRAYSSLAILYALSGRGPEVGAILKRMVDVNPTPLAYAEAVKTLHVLKDDGSAGSLLRMALGRFPGSTVLRDLARG